MLLGVDVGGTFTDAVLSPRATWAELELSPGPSFADDGLTGPRFAVRPDGSAVELLVDRDGVYRAYVVLPF